MAIKDFNDISHAARIERWKQAERVLKTLTPRQRKKEFDMANYGSATDCGTTACAAGFCGIDPWFRRRGLKMDLLRTDGKRIKFGTEPTAKEIRLFGDDDGTVGSTEFDGEQVLAFFGYQGAESIFFNTQQRSVGAVIAEVRRYIRDLEKTDPIDFKKVDSCGLPLYYDFTETEAA